MTFNFIVLELIKFKTMENEIDISFLDEISGNIHQIMWKRILIGVKKSRLKIHPDIEEMCMRVIQKIDPYPYTANMFDYYMKLTGQIEKLLPEPWYIEIKIHKFSIGLISFYKERRIKIDLGIPKEENFFGIGEWLTWGHELGHLITRLLRSWNITMPEKSLEQMMSEEKYPCEQYLEIEHIADEIGILFLRNALLVINKPELQTENIEKFL